jgi:glucose/arabinose dehydrogenase
MKKNISIIVCIILFNFYSQAQPEIDLVPFATGFSSPLEIVNAGDDRLFVVQQRGLIRTLDTEGIIASLPFLNVTNKVSQSGGERGLLGLAFHPDFQDNGRLFISYTRTSDGANVISGFSLDSENPQRADSTSEVIILTVSQPQGNHNGGQILFGPDGYLYIAVGDGGGAGDTQNNAQNRNNLLGTILRIDVDNGSPYGIPADNPYVGDPSTLDEIWALGLRNPWKNSFDRYTGDLWIADVGQGELEEVNFQPASSSGGENYGWRCYEGNDPFNLVGCQDASNYIFPVFEYAHYGEGFCTGSITGGYVYRGALHNGLFGKYIAADYCKGDFYWVEKDESGGFSSGTLESFGTFEFSSFGEDQYGELYLSLLGSGQVQKLVDTSDCRPVAKVKEGNTVYMDGADSVKLSAFYHPSLEYQWKMDDEDIQGTNSHSIYASEIALYSVEVTNPLNDCDNLSGPTELVLGPPPTPTPTPTPTPDPTPTRINENRNLKNVHVYPNPATDKVLIESLPSGKEVIISIIENAGREVRKFSSHGNTELSIDISGLLPGLYLIKVQAGEDTFVKRIVKLRQR